MTTPSVCSLFVSSTTMVSPAFARMVGPGNWPLIPMTTFSTQSGDQNIYPTSHLKCLALEAKVECVKADKKKHKVMIKHLAIVDDRLG